MATVYATREEKAALETEANTLAEVADVLERRSVIAGPDQTVPSNPSARKVTFKSKTKTDPVQNRVVVPAQGSAGDPTVNGATLVVVCAEASAARIRGRIGDCAGRRATTSPVGRP